MLRSEIRDTRTGPFENQFTNPTLETAATGPASIRRNWATQPEGFGTSWGNVGCAATYKALLPITPDDITTGVKVIPDGATDTYVYTSAGNVNPVVPGRRISISMRYTSSRPLRGRLRYAFLNASDGVVGGIQWTDAVLSDNARLKVEDMVVPAGAVRISVGVGFLRADAGQTPADTIYISAPLIEDRTVALPFFWGGKPTTKGVSYVYESTVANSSSLARATLSEVFRNYHRNPGARNPSAANVDFSMWTGGGNNLCQVTPSAPADWTKSGRAFQCVWTNVDLPDNGDIGIGVTQATPGVVFTLEYTLFSNVSKKVSPPTLYSNPGTWTTHARSSAGTTDIVAGVPQKRWITFTIDANSAASGVRVVQGIYGKANGDLLAIGDVMLYPGPYRKMDYWDGNYTPNPDFAPGWTGVADNSASTLSALVPQGIGISSQSRVVMTSQAQKGKSIRIVNTSPTNKDSFAHLNGDTGGLRLGMVPGRTYTFVGWLTFDDLRDANTIPSARAYTRRSDGVGGYVTTIVTPPSSNPGRYLIRLIFTVPPTASEAFVRLYNNGFIGNNDVIWEEPTFVDGVYLGLPFSGDSPRCIWRGLPYASASAGYPSVV